MSNKDQLIDEFFSKFPRRTYSKGQILVFADETPKHIFYIKKGKVRQYGITFSGDEIVVNIFKPIAFFPMNWAINNSENKYFFRTEIETTLHIVPSDEALTFITTNPDIMLDLLSRVYRGMDGIYGKMVHLMSGNAKSRLIYELIIEAERFGLNDRLGQVKIIVNEQDLAARSGLSRETVSREMKKLKQLNLINLSGKTLVINNLDKLKQIVSAQNQALS